jgi:uncharacterized Zn finger protein (UPF0148 family)
MVYKGIKPVQMYCPNCGRLVTGYKREDDAVLLECPKCKVVLFSKQKNKREVIIKITDPK